MCFKKKLITSPLVHSTFLSYNGIPFVLEIDLHNKYKAVPLQMHKKLKMIVIARPGQPLEKQCL